jgi:hypothetical protein
VAFAAAAAGIAVGIVVGIVVGIAAALGISAAVGIAAEVGIAATAGKAARALFCPRRRPRICSSFDDNSTTEPSVFISVLPGKPQKLHWETPETALGNPRKTPCLRSSRAIYRRREHSGMGQGINERSPMQHIRACVVVIWII